MYDSRPTFAEISLAALHHNFNVIRSSIPCGTEILAVVKADAYGHGFMDISRELETLGVNAFGVAFLAEGIQLRKSGIDKPVLLLGGVYPGQRFDVILANPPFSGKVQDESILADLNFRLDTRATELLFLKWFIDHLTPNGRAGVIVPNGVLFGSTNAATPSLPHTSRNDASGAAHVPSPQPITVADRP